MKTRNITIALCGLALTLVSAIGHAATYTFSNTTPIAMPDGAAGSPYPSEIVVPQLFGSVTRVEVKLNGYHHGFSPNVDIMLVSPSGQQIMLMSDVGYVDSTPVNLTFASDGAPLDWGTTLTSTTYLPANSSNDSGGDTFPAPAPNTPSSLDLTTLNGPASASAGTWKLFVREDSAIETQFGAIDGGWSVVMSGADLTEQSCASEGYTYTKLQWCKNICEMGYTGATLNMWIRRWIDRYRVLPYCAVAPPA